MGKDSMRTIAIACVCSLVCGLAGGAGGAWFFGGSSGGDATFETLKVTKGILIQSGEAEGQGCKLLADGTATLTGGLIANQVRGQIFSGQNFLASTNPVNATLGDQQVMAQMTADPKSGGQIIARNRDATLIPAKGMQPQGSMAVIAFNAANGRPEIFTHDLAAGDLGRAFML